MVTTFEVVDRVVPGTAGSTYVALAELLIVVPAAVAARAIVSPAKTKSTATKAIARTT
jgi:hypothetical protein